MESLSCTFSFAYASNVSLANVERGKRTVRDADGAMVGGLRQDG
jgi:hypothetical protein